MQVGKKKKNYNPKKKTDKFYLSPFWKNMVSYIWQRDMATCQSCLEKGILKPLAKPSRDVNKQGHVDHKRARKMGGSNDEDNLWLICFHCHIEKTQQEGSRFYN